MTRTRMSVLTAAFFLLAGSLALFLVLFTGRSAGSGPGFEPKFGSGENAAEAAGEGPLGGYEAYLSAARTYPANVIPPAIAQRAEATFAGIAALDAKKGDPKGKGGKWNLYGPRTAAIQPGVTSFSGATNQTASRTTSLVVSPDCGRKKGCQVWVTASGGGVWTTDNALAPDPEWKQLRPQERDLNSSGVVVLDPTDKKNQTLYYGTGEANRCSSGCEAGVGIYRSTDGGEHWSKLADACVSNGTYACVTPGKDAFLGRGIKQIVIDPRNANHIFVGSTLGVRGLSHVIGNGGTTRFAPGANDVGLYESFDGGTTFTEVWNGNAPTCTATTPQPCSFGVTDVGLDPLNPDTVYATAFDQGVWRRDAGAAATAFQQVFKPQFVPPQCTPLPGSTTCAFQGLDRAMFALTVKNGHTRIYLTEGTQNIAPTGFAGITSPYASNFWRIDNANQPAATLLASQGAGSTPPDPTTHTFPATYNGWQKLTAQTTGNPYFATDDFCTGQCWYDQDLYTPAGMPDTVYVIGSNQYGEEPCNTKGVGCGNGRSNGREVLYSNTAGDPDAVNNNRTFTDLSYDAQDTPAPWCAYGPYPGLFAVGMGDCLRAPNGIHPDQHAIAINPSNPTQIFEGSDGGVIRTSGSFADISSQCDERGRAGNLSPGSQLACKRLLSRVPTLLQHVDKKYSSTLQFINVVINPSLSCEVMGGTQDNGTWSNNNGCSRNTFQQVIYGDGGNAVYDATNPSWRANEFTGGFGDSNFRNGDPERWVITTAPMVISGETFAFYWPQIGDPNPVPGTHPIYNGGNHVWRTWAFGAGTPDQVPQDTTPSIADYEANCPEFVTFGGTAGCGDYQPLGGPVVHNPDGTLNHDVAGDLTGAVYGPDRTGGSMSWLARDSADHGTLWAATSAGRIFVTHNADAADPATVVWHRIDSSTSGNSPTRFPSAIYVDPADTGHAWISYSGYNAVTPTTPGHVFDVHENGSAPGSGTFANLNVESGTSAFPTPASDGDLPVSDVVRDDATDTLYVSTDFGVLRGDDDGTGGWHVTAGMPRYEVMHLAIQPSSRDPVCKDGGSCKRLLYAATHSQGIWQMNLGGVH